MEVRGGGKGDDGREGGIEDILIGGRLSDGK